MYPSTRTYINSCSHSSIRVTIRGNFPFHAQIPIREFQLSTKSRTGKRDLSGMLNDGMNSLARFAPPRIDMTVFSLISWKNRMYTAAFSDFFSQAVIDYMLGHRGLSVFSEFTLNLRSTDPRELFRLSKIRAIAIETCTALVVMDGEEVKAGWTLFSPVQLNVKLDNVFEEKVLLLVNFFCTLKAVCAAYDSFVDRPGLVHCRVLTFPSYLIVLEPLTRHFYLSEL